MTNSVFRGERGRPPAARPRTGEKSTVRGKMGGGGFTVTAQVSLPMIAERTHLRDSRPTHRLLTLLSLLPASLPGSTNVNTTLWVILSVVSVTRSRRFFANRQNHHDLIHDVVHPSGCGERARLNSRLALLETHAPTREAQIQTRGVSPLRRGVRCC